MWITVDTTLTITDRHHKNMVFTPNIEFTSVERMGKNHLNQLYLKMFTAPFL